MASLGVFTSPSRQPCLSSEVPFKGRSPIGSRPTHTASTRPFTKALSQMTSHAPVLGVRTSASWGGHWSHLLGTYYVLVTPSGVPGNTAMGRTGCTPLAVGGAGRRCVHGAGAGEHVCCREYKQGEGPGHGGQDAPRGPAPSLVSGGGEVSSLVHTAAIHLCDPWVYLLSVHPVWLGGHQGEAHGPWPPLPCHPHFCAHAASSLGQPPTPWPHPAHVPGQLPLHATLCSKCRCPLLWEVLTLPGRLGTPPSTSSRQPCPQGLLAASHLEPQLLRPGRQILTPMLPLPREHRPAECVPTGASAQHRLPRA